MEKKRNRISLFLLFLALTIPLLLETLQGREQGEFITLKNGFKAFLVNQNTGPLVHIVLAVNLGSKDETQENNGRVHLLEHLVLLGSTKKRTSQRFISELRAKGAYPNAHTDHDLMTLEISLPREHIDFALDFIKEKISQLSFPAQELADEKAVILQEIEQLKDDPVTVATDLALGGLFENHTYEKPLYGKIDVIMETTAPQLAGLYQSFLVPGNCSICVVGDFDSQKVKEKISNLFASPATGLRQRDDYSPPLPLKKNREIIKEIDNNQAYALIGFQAPAFNHQDFATVKLLTRILGRLLPRVLGGKNQSAERVFVRYISLKQSGAILIYLVTKTRKRKIAVKKALKFLKRASFFRYSKKDFLQKEQDFVFDYLESAQNHIKLIAQEAKEQGLHTAIVNARYLLLHHRTGGMNFTKDTEKITSARLREAAHTYFGRAHQVTLYLVPRKKEK